MPMFDFICEACGAQGRQWRRDTAPRSCNRGCLKKIKWRSGKTVKHIVTPEMHDAIRQAYAGETGNGQINDLAARIGLPRWKVTRYAISQGWTARTNKEPDWTAKEIDILERSAHRAPEVIQRYLKRAGFKRSVTGIILKRKRMRLLQNLEGQSAQGLAGCFGIDVHCVMRWINRGQLKAMPRGLHRTPQQGGDIYLIKDRWVRDFVLANLAEVDLRKVDKYWFVDLIANGSKNGEAVGEIEEE
jgi:hypothetical protein